MKKNFKKVSVVLMMAIGATFTMTSCGGGSDLAEGLNDLAKDLEESSDAIQEDLDNGSEGEGEHGHMYESEDGSFVIDFLGGTPVVASESVPTEVGNIEMTTFMYEKSATEIYMVAYNDYPSEIISLSEPIDLLQGGKEGVVNSMGITEFAMEEEDMQDGYLGLHFKGTNGTYYVEYKMFLVENRLYQVGLLRDGSYAVADRVEEFFGSFKFNI